MISDTLLVGHDDFLRHSKTNYSSPKQPVSKWIVLTFRAWGFDVVSFAALLISSRTGISVVLPAWTPGQCLCRYETLKLTEFQRFQAFYATIRTRSSRTEHRRWSKRAKTQMCTYPQTSPDGILSKQPLLLRKAFGEAAGKTFQF